MLIQTAEDLEALTAILANESDHGLVLVALDLIDRGLCDVLRSFFRVTLSATRLIEGQSPHLATLASRLAACHALGLIDDAEYADIVVITKLPGCAVSRPGDAWSSTPQGTSLCARLTLSGRDGPDPGSACRDRLIGSAVNLLLRLQLRPARVAEERRQVKAWASPDASDWRTAAFGAASDERDGLGLGGRS